MATPFLVLENLTGFVVTTIKSRSNDAEQSLAPLLLECGESSYLDQNKSQLMG